MLWYQCFQLKHRELLLSSPWCAECLSGAGLSLQAEEGEQEEPEQQKRQSVPLPDKVPLPLPHAPQAVSGAGGLHRGGSWVLSHLVL